VSIFVDTSAFFAVAVEQAAGHDRLTQVLAADDVAPVTTTAVLTELWGLMRARFDRTAGDRLIGALLRGAVHVEPVGPGDLLRAMEIGEEFADQPFSLVDRTSFAVMHRLGLHRVATLDHHFAVYRFGPGRRKAFEIAY
jgi:predicted nucleic acid-binding protein